GMRPSRILDNMMDKEFAEAEEMLNRMFRTVREINPSELTNNAPYYYGYQVTVGPDGKPHVREFGNMRASAKGLVEQTGVRAPMVDTALDEKQNTLKITAEMPGVNKEDIKVDVSDQYVTIHAEKAEKKYHADIPVDVELDDASAKATYSNGILELKIKLKQTPKSKAKAIRVE
ncbi:MAG: archaeal heat shock protein Hsp20, partial [Nitrososphaeraceae archaeon]